MEIIDIEKLNRWAKEIHDNATAHGWHEEKHSPEHWLSLIMCEVAEAIEADRKDKRVPSRAYIGKFVMNTDEQYNAWYEAFIKGRIEEEFSDIVIRLLDMAVECNCSIQYYECYEFNEKKIFSEQAWFFVTHLLGSTVYGINAAISFMYSWAEHLGINLDQHIEWKMKYNESRPYKHGGKKY